MRTIKNCFIRVYRIGYLLSALVVLVVGDGLITQFLIKGGLGREGNPLLAPIAGGGNFLLIKVAGALRCFTFASQ